MMFSESMPALKHSFRHRASMLSCYRINLPRMSYGDRLQKAMELSGKSRGDLARALGKSVQAIGQCIRGETGAFTAENSARAAALCRVDHYWLATGDGHPRPDRAWPFDLFGPDEYALVPAEYRKRLENELAGEIQRAKRMGNGTTG